MVDEIKIGDKILLNGKPHILEEVPGLKKRNPRSRNSKEEPPMVGDGADAATIQNFEDQRLKKNAPRPRKVVPPKQIDVSKLGHPRIRAIELAESEPVKSVFDISKTKNSPAWERVREVLQESYPAERYLLVGLHFSSKDGAEVVTLTIKKDPRS